MAITVTVAAYGPTAVVAGGPANANVQLRFQDTILGRMFVQYGALDGSGAGSFPTPLSTIAGHMVLTFVNADADTECSFSISDSSGNLLYTEVGTTLTTNPRPATIIPPGTDEPVV